MKFALFECSKLSIYQAYFEARFVKNLSISEPQIEKHHAYKKRNMYLFSVTWSKTMCVMLNYLFIFILGPKTIQNAHMSLFWQIQDCTSVFLVYEAESFSNELTSVENLMIKLSLSSVNCKLLYKRSAGEAKKVSWVEKYL